MLQFFEVLNRRIDQPKPFITGAPDLIDQISQMILHIGIINTPHIITRTQLQKLLINFLCDLSLLQSFFHLLIVFIFLK